MRMCYQTGLVGLVAALYYRTYVCAIAGRIGGDMRKISMVMLIRLRHWRPSGSQQKKRAALASLALTTAKGDASGKGSKPLRGREV